MFTINNWQEDHCRRPGEIYYHQFIVISFDVRFFNIYIKEKENLFDILISHLFEAESLINTIAHQVG